MGEHDAWEKTLMEHNEVFVDIVNGLCFKGTRASRWQVSPKRPTMPSSKNVTE